MLFQRHDRRPIARTLPWLPGLTGLLLGAAPPAWGEEPPAEKAPVQLDRLLDLPESLDYGVERRAGATPGEWRERFREAERSLSDARAELAASEAELATLGEDSEGWALAPPGAGAKNQDAPLSYQLRMQIRRQRDEVERAERRLRELQIEANLANVPPDWRH